MADCIRQTAYFLWEQDGRPEGRACHYLLYTKEMPVREYAYDRLLGEGTPVDRA